MKSTILALQDLYKKLGGNLTDTYASIAGGIPVSQYVTIPDMIEACTQKAGSGGGSGSALPAVTSDDNGDVLTVVEGAWAKATPVNKGFVYAASGDYSTGDSLNEEDLDAINYILGEGGIIMIQSSAHGVFIGGSVNSTLHNYKGDSMTISEQGEITITLAED